MDMLDVPIGEFLKKALKAVQNDSKDKQVKKYRIVEKFGPNAQKVIQQLINTKVNLLLKTVLGNMPEVCKKLFQTGYTTEEFEKLELNSISQGQISEGDESQLEDNSEPRSQVNSLLLGRLLDYVLVEVVVGKVIQCYYIVA